MQSKAREFVPIWAAAVIFRCHPSTIRRHIKAHNITTRKIKNVVHVDFDELQTIENEMLFAGAIEH